MEVTAALQLEHLEEMKYTQAQVELSIEKEHNHFRCTHMRIGYTRMDQFVSASSYKVATICIPR